MASKLIWYEGDRILPISSMRSLRSVLEEIENKQPEWIVLVRVDPEGDRPITLYYVFPRTEFIDEATNVLGAGSSASERVEKALGLKARDASRVAVDKSHVQELSGLETPALTQDTAARTVRMDGSGGIVSIGFYQSERKAERPDKKRRTRGTRSSRQVPSPSRDASKPEIMLGSTRSAPARSGHEGAAAEPADTAPDKLRISLSAEIKREINLGEIEALDYRAELADAATPLALSVTGEAKRETKIRVVTSTEGDSVKILGKRIHTIPVPGDSKPSTGVFEVEALGLGHARIAVSFRQGGSELGAITLAIEVVEEQASSTTASGAALARSRDPAEDEALELLIETKPTRDSAGRDTICYEYRLNSLNIGFNYMTVRSKPLLNSADAPAKTISEYVERLYSKVAPPLKSMADAQKLLGELKVVGVSLCEELFEPEVTGVLWPVRNQLKVIKLTTWEPFIPWELIRLANPDTKEIDARYLCEYGLIRTESGKMPPTELRLDRWAYLAANYSNMLHAKIGEEVSYFTDVLPATGITPVALDSQAEVFLTALRDADFDVLHIACHGDSPHDTIEDARLVIGDRMGAGGVSEAIEVFPGQVSTEVKYSSKFVERHPLVFLNGCETGRLGARLTTWGGWPKVFIDAGAGVFVGTSWPVRDKPAAVFAKSFYDTLRDGSRLVDAATQARTEAKKCPDGSWLAFKVYGHPMARLV